MDQQRCLPACARLLITNCWGLVLNLHHLKHMAIMLHVEGDRMTRLMRLERMCDRANQP